MFGLVSCGNVGVARPALYILCQEINRLTAAWDFQTVFAPGAACTDSLKRMKLALARKNI